MSEINDIKRRLSAVAQTRQITNAMYLLSSSRMRREAQRAGYAKEYFHRIRATVKDIMEKSQSITHPYFEKRSGNRAAFLVIAGDKGLCGTYNSDVLKYAHALISEHPVHYIKTVGRIATEFSQGAGSYPMTKCSARRISPRCIRQGIYPKSCLNFMKTVRRMKYILSLRGLKIRQSIIRTA